MRVLAYGLAMVSLAACSRYELRPTECGPEPPPDASAIAWEADTLPPGTIDGRVIGIASPTPLAAARITLEPGGRAWNAGADGRFRADSVPPGEYTMIVRRIGYWPATRAVILGEDRGVSLLVLLARSMMTLDGCGSAMVRVRKPWWKFW
jgi:hypothetical protein